MILVLDASFAFRLIVEEPDSGAVRHRHPIYDCFYLALALREGVTLAAADRRLLALAKAEGVLTAAVDFPQPSSSA